VGQKFKSLYIGDEGMANDKIKTTYPGVRYREYPGKKHNGKPDRSFFIRYQGADKPNEEAVGKTSEGMNAAKASVIRSEIVKNIREGKRPQSLKEKREMEEARRQAEEQQRLQEKQDKFPFSALAEQYIKWAKANKKSWRDDEQRYRSHLAPELAAKPLKDIGPLNLEKIKRTLQKKDLSDATVKHCLVLIRQMFNKATTWGLFDGSNPMKGVKIPSLNNKRDRFLTHEEANSLLMELAKSSPQTHDQALLALHCGLRFGEIAALTWSDLNFQQNLINVRDPKSSESRQAFMPDTVHKMLQNRRPQDPKPTELVFKDRNGNRQQSVSNAFDRVIKRLGFNKGIKDRKNKVVFHTLRHTFASWLAIQGESILTIKELMGHKTLAMTERYAHLMPSVKQEAVERLANGFKMNQEKVKIIDLGNAS